MSEKTKIQWADDTWNPWRGCTKVSPGCKNCYAETLVTGRLEQLHYETATSGSNLSSKHFAPTSGRAASGISFWGEGSPRIRAVNFAAPLAWNKKPWVCGKCGHCMTEDQSKGYNGCPDGRIHYVEHHRRRVFSLSLGDCLDEEVPIEWLADMLDVIRRCPNLDFLLLTKRLENWLPRLEEVLLWLDNKKPEDQDDDLWGFVYQWLTGERDIAGDEAPTPPSNVWLGVSVENQATADERIPQLLKIPAAIRFLSVEPLLENLNLNLNLNRPDWVIVGGESGHHARPCNIEWIRSVKNQCAAAGVPCFVKQLGSKPESDYIVSRDEFLKRITDKKGGDLTEWPADLRIRQFPCNK